MDLREETKGAEGKRKYLTQEPAIELWNYGSKNNKLYHEMVDSDRMAEYTIMLKDFRTNGSVHHYARSNILPADSGAQLRIDCVSAD